MGRDTIHLLDIKQLLLGTSKMRQYFFSAKVGKLVPKSSDIGLLAFVVGADS